MLEALKKPLVNNFHSSLTMHTPRTQFLRLMRNARVICFDGQEIISVLISHFELEDEQGLPTLMWGMRIL